MARAIPSRKSNVLVKAYKQCYEQLLSYGFTAQLIRTDNEVSQKLIEAITGHHLEYQLASQGDHRKNPAERAIKDFKAHFISVRNGADDEFPPWAWDLLLPLTELTLNLLRASRINPLVSAYTQL